MIITYQEYQKEKVFILVEHLLSLGFPKKPLIRAAFNATSLIAHLVRPEYIGLHALALSTVDEFLKKETITETDILTYQSLKTQVFQQTRNAFYAASAASAYTLQSISELSNSVNFKFSISCVFDYIANAKRGIESPELIFRNHFDWENICAFQIAKIFNKEKDWETFLNPGLIAYTTTILSQEELIEEFEFLIRDAISSEGKWLQK